MATTDSRADPRQIVADLAEQSRWPIDDVASIYEREFAELEATARVTSFLHIFAVRNVRAILQGGRDSTRP